VESRAQIGLTLVYQCLRAENANNDFGYSLNYWRTVQGVEVDFVLYGERGFHAFEVKRRSIFRESDVDGLRLFCQDYPAAKGHLFYGGTKRYSYDNIEVVPLEQGLMSLRKTLAG